VLLYSSEVIALLRPPVRIPRRIQQIGQEGIAGGLTHIALCHALALSQVLVSPLGQLRISCLGVLEALSGEPAGGPPEDLLAAQREDVTVRQRGQGVGRAGV
jgi:hypothetical protein